VNERRVHGRARDEARSDGATPHDVFADGDRGDEAELALVHVEAGEEHRGLRRDRDARALGHHQQEDPGEPQIADDVRREVRQLVGDGGENEGGSNEH